MFGGYAYLRDVSGKEMGRISCSDPLLPGSTLSIGGKDVEVDSMMSKDEYLSGRNFPNIKNQPPPVIHNQDSSIPKPKPKVISRDVSKTAVKSEKEEAKKLINVAAPKSLATQTRWKNPMLADTVMPKKEGILPIPRHDPDTPGAIVMKRPIKVPRGKQIVDVVVDPLLTKHLRPHQVEGVKFLYECVMGMRDFEGQGAILADDMGLGKTLQTITLLWTLLKQNPIHECTPVIKKAVVVCPTTLIENWQKEFRKWLGKERIGVFVANDTKKRITDFTLGKSYNVMIIGYERLRNVQEELKKGPGIDIVIADEGHRLKTAQNKSALAIRSLNTSRIVILSGTPLQNDLTEFFMMVDLINPGLLGTFKTFKKQFEEPIIKSRQPGALEKDVERGIARGEELAKDTNTFILRRTIDILSKYLPPKTEFVLFCRPTSAQASVYRHVLASPMFQSALGNPEAHLQLITILKKVCNSPKLLSRATINPEKVVSPLTISLLSTIPPQLLSTSAGSAKIRVLDQLLHTIRSTTSEKVVLVSNFTSTLDLLSTLLSSVGLDFLRLDGSTPSSKRQDLVDTFNRTPASKCFAFLLSAKAGGMGLNLIGASRLVLFDVDWNPSVDLQAMGRIHRDGQKRPCVIYRLLMAGGLDEKIWQRQVTKLGLASSVMEQKGGTSSFTREELRDLFRLDDSLSCQTHDLIGCLCGGKGYPDVSTADLTDTITGPREENDEDFPDITSVIETSRINMVEQDAKIKPEPIQIDVDEEEDEEDESTKLPTPIKASQVNMVEQEVRIKQNTITSKKQGGSAKMQSLMTYSHVDTSKFAADHDQDMEALIQDDVLLDVLKDEGNRVSFVFAKTSAGCS